MKGLVCDRPARSSTLSTFSPSLRRIGEDAGEGAERHDHVDEHVEQHAAHARHRAGGETDERVAHVTDRGIGHQALDVLLADRRKGSEQHRSDRDEDDDLLPLGQRPARTR